MRSASCDLLCVCVQNGQLLTELEEAKTLADSRLKEAELLSQQIIELRTDLELAKEAKPESHVATSTPYLALQSQFSVVQQGEWERGEGQGERELWCAENAQLRVSVEELKTLLYEARAQHFTQLDELR